MSEKAGEIEPWTLVENPLDAQLVFDYEAVLTEMRTHATKGGDRTVARWVERLDFARNEYVRAAIARAEGR